MSLTQFKKLALGLVGIRFQKRVCTSFVIISLSFFYASAAKNAVDAMIARAVFLFLFCPQIYCVIKGQLISKCVLGLFTFFQKNWTKSSRQAVKSKLVRSIFGRNVRLKKSFRICLTFSEYQFNFLLKIVENFSA